MPGRKTEIYHMAALPAPSPDAAAHSARLADLIRGEIQAAGGWIPFARYMELALYAPAMGYYAAGTRKFGREGDFVTAPELGSLFARSLARCVADVLGEAGGAVLELGAGSGRLAADLLAELASLDAPPDRYCILEPSAELAWRQRRLLTVSHPALAERVEWLDALPATFTGVILANEVLDALPVHLLLSRAGAVWERGVINSGEGFAWADRPCADAALEARAAALGLPEGYLIELNPAAAALVRSLGERLESGLVLFIDYGFGRREFYHPQRHRGTLACHYRHHVHDDPFFLPGLCDITAHVEFTALAEAGAEVGLDVVAFTTQAHFLLDCGLTELLSANGTEDALHYLPLANEAQRLISPAEMGELFKVLALGRGLGRAPRGLRGVDQRHRL